MGSLSFLFLLFLDCSHLLGHESFSFFFAKFLFVLISLRRILLFFLYLSLFFDFNFGLLHYSFLFLIFFRFVSFELWLLFLLFFIVYFEDRVSLLSIFNFLFLFLFNNSFFFLLFFFNSGLFLLLYFFLLLFLFSGWNEFSIFLLDFFLFLILVRFMLFRFSSKLTNRFSLLNWIWLLITLFFRLEYNRNIVTSEQTLHFV
mmetsp:Transcript_47917/g.64968  ORF Transcript_47917/g.64968 Transcript_47917/m.64968 type:complete len:201 (-) Transcript_47917:769-1371(-)